MDNKDSKWEHIQEQRFLFCLWVRLKTYWSVYLDSFLGIRWVSWANPEHAYKTQNANH